MTGMTTFVAGLLLFFVPHSVRFFAEDWRVARIARLGPKRWKAIYSVVSFAGFVLLVWGYGMARRASPQLWTPPEWGHAVAVIATLVAFILVAASHMRGNHIKAAIGHPLALGTAVWGLAHLFSNGRVADVLLFGAFLLWGAAAFVTARARDAKAGVTYPAAAGAAKDAMAIVGGIIVWAVFGYFLHGPLIGVPAFG